MTRHDVFAPPAAILKNLYAEGKSSVYAYRLLHYNAFHRLELTDSKSWTASLADEIFIRTVN